MAHHSCTVYLGIVGWMHEDWKGIVYPRTPPRGFDPLGYLAKFVDCIEVDDTSFHPLTPFMAARWAEKTAHNADFRFVVRVWQRFTHQREGVWSSADAAIFQKGVQPLADAGRLGALLFQFPVTMHCDERGKAWLQRLARDFEKFPRLIEIRHPSWVTDEGLAVLRKLGFGFCMPIPSMFLRSVNAGELAIGGYGAFRVQGREPEEEAPHAPGHGDFALSRAEIAELASRVNGLASKTDRLFVMFGNHARGQSVVNALQLKAALSGRQVEVPEELREAHKLPGRLTVDLSDTLR